MMRPDLAFLSGDLKQTGVKIKSSLRFYLKTGPSSRESRVMRIRTIESSEIALIAGWLGDKENYQWLDFGSGNQALSAISLRVMTQRDIHVIRCFTSDVNDAAIGLVALSDFARNFGTATLWYLLGDKAYSGQGYTTRAVSEALTLGFMELGLRAVNAWAIEHNVPSIRILERNNFLLIGRQRQCHMIDGRVCDRLLFDLLEAEHQVAPRDNK